MELLYRILDKKNYSFKNLWSNRGYLISATACYMLIIRFHIPYLLSFVLSILAAGVVAATSPNLYKIVRNKNKGIQIWAFLTSIAMIPDNAEYFFWRTNTSERTVTLIEKIIPNGMNTMHIICYVFSVIAVYFWFVTMCFLCEWIWKLCKKIWCEGKKEHFICIAIGILFGCFVLATFRVTDIFYRGALVYGADSDVIISKNAYLVSAHMENDLRQPLFAILSSPFVGVPYLISWFIPVIKEISVLIIMLSQIPVLVFSCLILSQIMSDDENIRCILIILMSCCYSTLLFVVMTEQYIISTFWLFIAIYLIVKQKDGAQEAVVCATGTLVTGIMLVPFFVRCKNGYKEIVKKIFETGLLCFFMLTLFGKLDVILTFLEQMKELGQFLGVKLSLSDKVLQYFHFVTYTFMPPNAGIQRGEWTSWGIDRITSIDFVGVILLLLAFWGFWFNRKERFAGICVYWILFSMFVIIIAGWGAEENCTILYSLYFGWAFLVLLWKLICSVLKEKNRKSWIFPIGICVSVLLLFVNIPALNDLMQFAIQYCPK